MAASLSRDRLRILRFSPPWAWMRGPKSANRPSQRPRRRPDAEVAPLKFCEEEKLSPHCETLVCHSSSFSLFSSLSPSLQQRARPPASHQGGQVAWPGSPGSSLLASQALVSPPMGLPMVRPGPKSPQSTPWNGFSLHDACTTVRTPCHRAIVSH